MVNNVCGMVVMLDARTELPLPDRIATSSAHWRNTPGIAP